MRGPLLPVQVPDDHQAALVVHFKEFLILIFSFIVIIIVVVFGALKGSGGDLVPREWTIW